MHEPGSRLETDHYKDAPPTPGEQGYGLIVAHTLRSLRRLFASQIIAFWANRRSVGVGRSSHAVHNGKARGQEILNDLITLPTVRRLSGHAA